MPVVRAAARPAIASRRAQVPGFPAPRRALPAALVTLRPRQWIKNLLVIAAAGAGGATVTTMSPGGWVSHSSASACSRPASTINDVRDAEEDRLHPQKASATIAAGELAPRTAIALGIALMLAGIRA